MKRFFFIISAIFLIINANALTITCTDTGDIDCKIPETNQVIPITNCEDIKKINDSNILRYPYEMLTKCKEWNDFEYKNKNCPYVAHAYIKSQTPEEYDIIAFCITNKDVVLEYTDDQTTSWSYNQKKCVGSGGTWKNNSCDCSNLTGTASVDNECLCTGNSQNQKYFGKLYSGCNTLKNGVTAAKEKTTITGFGNYDLKKIDKVNSCGPSGGEWSGPDKNTCSCKEDLNMELAPSGYFCNCKQDYHYKDPLRKSQGCVSINTRIPISGSVTDTQKSPLKGVSVYVADDATLSTFTDDTGNYTLNEVPNTAQISFSLQGYETKTIMVDYLSGNKTIMLQPIAPGDPTEEEKGKPEEVGTGNLADENTVSDGNEKENTAQTNTDTNAIKKLQEAQNALKSAQDTENSLANRLLGGASTAATGLGGMMIAQGLAEQKADKDAEADMRAYLATFKCEYGNGQYANAGNEEITLPGGNELLEYYNEYKTLADNLKTTKTALGLRTGIESEVLYDRAQSGLYQYSTAERQSGGEISLARALSDGTGEDAARWAEQKEQTAKQLKTGAIVAGAGVVGGIAGNYLINGRNQKTEEIKQEFKKAEERIEKEYPQSIVSIPELESKTVSELKTILPSNITQSSSTLESIQTLSIKNFQSDESIFDPGEFTINNTHTDALDKYLAETENILSNPDNATVKVCISVIGHTDRTIPKPRQEYKDNKGLSELRANSVKMYVESKLNNVKDHIISIISKGKGDEECFEGYYARNDRNCRRVEINIMDCSRISPELL